MNVKGTQQMYDEKIYVTQSSMPPYEEYIEAIKPLWETHWLTNMGTYHRELEEKLRQYLDVPALSLMVNGHMSLELAIQAFDFPEGAEIITTPFTFISTTHAIIRNHLCPVFCDVKLSDGTIDEMKIEELITEKTVAILPVHVYGNVCNVEEIQRIADKYDLKVIYDAAHAFGVKYKGRGIGSYGDASIFSFHATKVYHTIEGGAVCCKTKEQYEKLYNLKNFGIRSQELIVSVGANAKMNEFQAAMGICNLKHLQDEITKRKAVVELYWELLDDVKGINTNYYRAGIEPNYAYFPVIFETAKKRDIICYELSKHDIYARKYFYPLTSDAACFKNKYKNMRLENARFYSERVLTLPLYSTLEKDSVEKIVRIVKENL